MTQIKLRRDTSANFTSANPILGVGEPAYETDTKKLKIGDGTTDYNNLTYFTGSGNTFEVVQPLKLVDDTLTLQIDEQTIQVQNGKLVVKDQVRVRPTSARKDYEALASLAKYTATYDGYIQAVLISDTSGFFNMYNVNNGLGFAGYVPAGSVFKAYVDVSAGDEVLLEYPGTLTHKELFNGRRGDV